MNSLLFKKKPFSYETAISLKKYELPDSFMKLDTGSPITIISIPVLLQITGESLVALRNKISGFFKEHSALSFGSYGFQVTNLSYSFIPYIVKDIDIGGSKWEYFMFWVDITNYMSKDIKVTSTLFGFDYFSQGTKSFDAKDNLIINYDKGLHFDTYDLGYALTETEQIIDCIEFFGSKKSDGDGIF